MGMHLISREKSEFRWANYDWISLLSIAEKHGWIRKGTTIPEDYPEKVWSGNYWSNDGQTVEEDDAMNLGQALEKALPTLPVAEIQIPKAIIEIDPVTRTPKIPNWDSIPPENFFSGPNGRLTVEKFIEFCKKGSFELC
jgi:hypothetical protein